ncbi:hypothetical protein TPAR_04818, partial [Tolypocladium paradoxum]
MARTHGRPRPAVVNSTKYVPSYTLAGSPAIPSTSQ